MLSGQGCSPASNMKNMKSLSQNEIVQKEIILPSHFGAIQYGMSYYLLQHHFNGVDDKIQPANSPIAFTLATLGFVYLIESLLVISFNAYSYYPKIVDDLFQDTVLGNVFSQVSISTTSALTIVMDFHISGILYLLSFIILSKSYL